MTALDPTYGDYCFPKDVIYWLYHGCLEDMKQLLKYHEAFSFDNHLYQSRNFSN